MRRLPLKTALLLCGLAIGPWLMLIWRLENGQISVKLVLVGIMITAVALIATSNAIADLVIAPGTRQRMVKVGAGVVGVAATVGAMHLLMLAYGVDELYVLENW
jgi:multisubunit Na+/H+ antiporter MnhE subunit